MIINEKDLDLVCSPLYLFFEEIAKLFEDNNLESYDIIKSIANYEFHKETEMYVIKKIDQQLITSPALRFASTISPVDILVGFERGLCKFVPAKFLCIGLPFRIIEKVLNKDPSLDEDLLWKKIKDSPHKAKKASRLFRKIAYGKLSEWITYSQRIEYLRMRQNGQKE